MKKKKKKKFKTYREAYEKRISVVNRQLQNKKGKYFERWKAGVLLYMQRKNKNG